MPQLTEHRLPNASALADALATHVSERLREVLKVQTSAVLAVSGGKSPIPFFQALSMTDLPWHAIHITLIDDRCVPNDHPDSNAALIRAHLLRNYAKSSAFSPLIDWDPASDAPDFDAVAASASDVIQKIGRIDVAVLGMGPDGHTASLFPMAPQLATGMDLGAKPGCLRVSPQTAPYERISLNLAAILNSDTICVAIGGGADKHAVYEDAKRETTNQYPISHVLRHTADVPTVSVWLHN